MSELKPCPFCGREEPVLQMRYIQGTANRKHYCYECPACRGTRNTWYKSVLKAVKGWNRRARPANEPLTLDELRAMGGQPVWIVEYPDWGHWELSADAADYLCDRDPDFYGMKHDDPAGKYGLHVLGWLAYRTKPKEGTGSQFARISREEADNGQA